MKLFFAIIFAGIAIGLYYISGWCEYHHGTHYDGSFNWMIEKTENVSFVGCIIFSIGAWIQGGAWLFDQTHKKNK